MGKYRYVVLAAIPFIVLCIFLLDTASNCLVPADWDLVPFLGKWHAGSLTLRDLMTRDAEHRIFFPRLIMLSVAAITHWNTYYEIAINLLLGTGVCAILFRQIRKMEVFFNVQANAVYFLVSFFVFSLAQSENWLSGYNMMVWLNVLSFIAGVFLLAAPAFGLKKFLCAVAAGIVAVYSYGNGIIFWILGFVILWMRPLAGKKAALASWTAIAVLIAASYLWGYQKPPQNPSLLSALQHPLQAAGYFLVFFGSPLLPFSRFIVLVGFFGLICLTTFIFTAYHTCTLTRNNKAALVMVLPWFALAFYSIASAAFVTIARSGFGIDQATENHYVTTSSLLWIALVVLAPVSAQSFMRLRSGLLSNIVRNRVLQYICLIMFCALQISVAKHKWVWEKTYTEEKRRINNKLLAGDYNEALSARMVPADVHDRIAILKKYRLALFRE